MYKEKQAGTKAILAGALVIVTLIAFAGGYSFRVVQDFISSFNNSSSSAQVIVNSTEADNVEDSNPEIDFDLFWKVWNEVQTRHVDQEISEEELFYGALEGIATAAGDPYTVFLDPASTTQFNDTINGEFQGIGAEIGIKENQLTVIAPLANTPADRAGLLANDIIVKIDDADTLDISVDEAVALIRGEKGTDVTLTVAREGATDFIDVVITRDVIEIPAVEYEVISSEDKQVGVITISHFINGTSSQFNQVAQQVLIEQPDALIIDVRNNPGGLLDEVITIASEFEDEGAIVIEERFDGEELEYNSSGSGMLEDIFPTAILINEGSASASEILAGVLQDYDKAIVIGEQSYGKGSVQDYQEFDDGSSLKITVAKWLTPKGTSISDTGITPDILVEMTPQDYIEEKDPQLDSAIKELLHKNN